MAELTLYSAGVIFNKSLVNAKEAGLIFGDFSVRVCLLVIFCNHNTDMLPSDPLSNLSFYTALSSTLLEVGYGLDCLMAQFQGLDLRFSENWPGSAGLKWAATWNQVCFSSG